MESGFQHLQQFVSENRHARVPQKYFTPDGYGLGKWVSVQRRIWNTLSEERRQRLSQLPGWTSTHGESGGKEGFGYLQDYVAETRDSTAAAEHHPQRVPSGQWVSNQKSRCGRR